MIEPERWMAEAVRKLLAEFGPRLLFVGLQGSYAHGEASQGSDIDIQVVLDTLSAEDLKRYRTLLRTLPEGENACGFVSGRAELAHWPAYEVYPFLADTKAFYGELQPLLPAYTRADVEYGVQIMAANLYHATAHLCVTAGDADSLAGKLKGLFKSTFFILRLLQYLRGEQVNTKSALAGRLQGEELRLLQLSMDDDQLARLAADDPDCLFQMLLDFSGGILRSA